MKLTMNQNRVTVCGTVSAAPAYSHESYNRRFYRMELKVLRLSGQADLIPVLVDQEMLQSVSTAVGSRLKVFGQMRSCNYVMEQGNCKLLLAVFAQWVVETEEADCNHILISGALCKVPVLRRTPMGKIITDLMLAVNRPNMRRSDYLPCVAWGWLAQRIYSVPVGSTLSFEGRIQSRIYTKEVGEHLQECTAYEISLMRMTEEVQIPWAV